MSLNPALEDVNHCPRCGYGAFYNPKPVACTIVHDDEDGIVLMLTGVYSRSTDRIVVIVYTAHALGSPVPTEEALEVRAFGPTDIPWEELAFWSDDRALRDCLVTRPSSPVSSSPPSRAATRR